MRMFGMEKHHDFILDEALVYDEQQQPQLIRMEDYEELLSLRESMLQEG